MNVGYLCGSVFLSLAIAFIPSKSRAEVVELAPALVKGVKDPDAFDVARGLSLIRAFESIPAGERDKIRLSFYVQTRGGEPLPSNLGLTLATAETERAVTLLPSGELRLPELDQEAAQSAVIVTTTRRGTLAINYFVQPRLVPEMTLGALREALVQARGAWKKMYGPLTGWTVPTFTCAVGHYEEPSLATIRDPRPPGKIEWRSTLSKKIEVPVSDRRLLDEFVVDWGTPAPARVGGCVSSDRPDTR